MHDQTISEAMDMSLYTDSL